MVPSLRPWSPVLTEVGLVMVVSTGGPRTVTVAACDGDASEANATLICAAPDMAAAVMAGNLTAARLALTSRGLA
jgi:hypothetical protein